MKNSDLYSTFPAELAAIAREADDQLAATLAGSPLLSLEAPAALLDYRRTVLATLALAPDADYLHTVCAETAGRLLTAAHTSAAIAQQTAQRAAQAHQADVSLRDERRRRQAELAQAYERAEAERLRITAEAADAAPALRAKAQADQAAKTARWEEAQARQRTLDAVAARLNQAEVDTGLA